MSQNEKYEQQWRDHYEAAFWKFHEIDGRVVRQEIVEQSWNFLAMPSSTTKRARELRQIGSGPWEEQMRFWETPLPTLASERKEVPPEVFKEKSDVQASELDQVEIGTEGQSHHRSKQPFNHRPVEIDRRLKALKKAGMEAEARSNESKNDNLFKNVIRSRPRVVIGSPREDKANKIR